MVGSPILHPTTAVSTTATPVYITIPPEQVQNTGPVLCPGYHLELHASDGKSPLMLYPVALESQRVLPWTMSYINNKIILHSKNCCAVSPRTGMADGSLPRACISCCSLETNTLVMGIRHRALDGTHAKTPWTYCSPAHWLNLLSEKTKHLDVLKMSALNIGRKLLTSARHLDD